MLNLKKTVLDALDTLKATDVDTLDVEGLASFTDQMIIATGTSTRHVKAIADSVVNHVKELSFEPLSVEGNNEAEWILIDLGEIVVHVMLNQTREFYGLEKLWAKFQPAVETYSEPAALAY